MRARRVVELEEKLKQASFDYYNDSPTVTDEVYDAWRDELKELQADSPEITKVGAPVPPSEWVKVRHLVPMGSLDKVQTPEELTKWVNDLARDWGFEGSFLVTEKLDGISVSIRYEQGRLVQALTRGDGTIGEDITSNVLCMKCVPSEIDAGDLLVRGEIVLLKDDHKTYFPDKANPRNAASGTAKRLDGVGSEHLTVLTYQIVEGSDLSTEDEQFEKLTKLGFKCPRWQVLKTPTAINMIWQEYTSRIRDSLPYEIDGLVVRVNGIAEQVAMGDTHSRPRGATAFKFTAAGKETTAKDTIWQVGGTGRMTPVAVFDPVNLVGAQVSRASLYNQAYIEEIGFDIGATILVVRANDVIPRVSQVIKSTGTILQPPKNCSVCGAETTRDGEYIVCPNTGGCSAQVVGRIKQWVSELNILEWGDTLIQKLVDEKLVTNVADLYRLKQEPLAALERMGERSAEVALETLWASSPMALENFLGGLSIPLCATSIIRLVIDAGYDSLEKIQEMTYGQLLAIPGLGPKRADAIHDGLRKNKQLIQNLLAAGVCIKVRATGVLTGKSVCFTGKSVRKRGELEQLVISVGGTVKGSVGKGLTYLVMADANSTSTKAQAARKHGTTCISEEDFVAMCGGS
jgi:DNA ligase (NAD+)